MADFEPIIKKKASTLISKTVEVKGKDVFSRTAHTIAPAKEEKLDQIEHSIMKEIESKGLEDLKFRATTTQKVSPSTNLKVNTLRPFLKETEGMGKATFNEIINMLIDNYVQTKLSTRQIEAFQSIYTQQLEML